MHQTRPHAIFRLYSFTYIQKIDEIPFHWESYLTINKLDFCKRSSTSCPPHPLPSLQFIHWKLGCWFHGVVFLYWCCSYPIGKCQRRWLSTASNVKESSGSSKQESTLRVCLKRTNVPSATMPRITYGTPKVSVFNKKWWKGCVMLDWPILCEFVGHYCIDIGGRPQGRNNNLHDVKARLRQYICSSTFFLSRENNPWLSQPPPMSF